MSAETGSIEDVTSMVRRITNPRSLQSQVGVRIEGVGTRQIQVRPDNPRNLTRPGNQVTITLDAFQTNHINFSDSALWFRTRMVYPDVWKYKSFDGTTETEEDVDWNREFFTPRLLALGGASLINRFQIFSGPTELQNFEHYNILYGTLHAMAQTRDTPDLDTLMSVSQLQVPYCREFSYSGETDRVSQWYWIKIPLISVLDAAGNIPISREKDVIRLIFTLATADEVFKNLYMTPLITEDPDSTGVLSCTDIVPGIWTTTSTPGTFATSIQYDMSWEVSDIVLQVHGVNINSEDSEPLEVFTTSYTTMTTPTSGAKEERLKFPITKGSLNGLHAVLINPDYNTTQDAGAPSIDQWCRGGTVGAVTIDDGVNHYDPSIVWWAIEIGGRKYPTDGGAGDQVPDNRDSNTQLWHHEYNRYNHRNTVGGSTYPAMLTPFGEVGSTYVDDGASSWSVNNLQDFDFSLTGDQDPPITQYNGAAQRSLLSLTPSYYGMSESLYGGGSLTRMGYAHNDTVVRPGYTSNQKWRYNTPSGLTGGKFIMTCAFTPVDKNPQLIQGISTDRYSVDLLIRRQEAIDAYLTVPTEYVTNTHILPTVPLVEKAPMALVFMRYNVRLSFGDTSISIDQ